jgi:glyoxylase-like metal-dependent hydrolase (beta-lactamase superfamily II)
MEHRPGNSLARILTSFALFVAFLMVTAAPAVSSPPLQNQLLTDKTVKVSNHVWAIIGFPNIGIVVGHSATLVIDTGLGRRNGATVARAAKQLAPHNRLFLTTTHFHPEHAAGVLGFPTGTLLIRNQVQQEEMERHGEEMVRMFAGQSEQWRSLLTGEQLRSPDETFERDLRLDLGGGVTAQLLWFGATHTKGDELVFVDPDRTLISGDVVQNKVAPYIFGEGGTAAGWIAVVDEVAKLNAQHVLPEHSAIGDGTLVTQERSFLAELRDRSLVLKQDGDSTEQAGERLTVEFKRKYPDWSIGDLTSFVKAAYAE